MFDFLKGKAKMKAEPTELAKPAPEIAWTQREVVIGSDHAGFKLKEMLIAYLITKGISVEDVGCHSEEPVDYPDIAYKVADKVRKGKRGVLICGTGIGTCIAAYYRPTEVDLLIGNPAKAKAKLGWESKTPFPALVRLMVAADVERVKKKGY
jgi:hypothetical protein